MQPQPEVVQLCGLGDGLLAGLSGRLEELLIRHCRFRTYRRRRATAFQSSEKQAPSAFSLPVLLPAQLRNSTLSGADEIPFAGHGVFDRPAHHEQRAGVPLALDSRRQPAMLEHRPEIDRRRKALCRGWPARRGIRPTGTSATLVVAISINVARQLAIQYDLFTEVFS